MTNELMSPRDIAWHHHLGLLIQSTIKRLEKAEMFARSHQKTYVIDNPGAAVRLLEPGAFPLTLKHVIHNEDGTVKEIQETVWNAGLKVSPLADEVRVRAAKRQAAARAVVKVESRDDRHDSIVDEKTGLYIDLGRTNREARNHSSVQGVRLTNFDRGSLYSGGQKAVRDAMKEKRKYDALPPAKAEKIKADKIAELEQKIAELVGKLGK